VATVRTHLGRIFERNDLGDRAELILLVFAIAQSFWMSRYCHHP
jgi:DNA-binding CsgD family transcriptional regulator